MDDRQNETILRRDTVTGVTRPMRSASLLLWVLSAILRISGLAQAPPPPSIEFTNATMAAGIKFTHFKGNKGISINREEFGPGVCVADFDGDGFQDIYFVNGRDLYDRGISVRNALYRNNGDGTFTDVTEKAGVPGTGYGLGCVWGDYDNDGFPDLFVTQYGRNVLYHNNGNGTFTDVTDKAGVAGMESGTFHSGATFFDYDRDGRLDLYVGSYVDMGDRRYCDLGGVQSSCPPSVYRGSPDALYHNNGDGTFTNVTVKAKIYQPEGKNLSVGASDYDNDGWPDLFVANDGLSAYLYHNQHDGTFKEIGLDSGMAFTGQGVTMAAMCISLGDFNNDGWFDLYISDFQRSSDHIWQNDGKGFFDEVSEQAGITRATHDVLSFGGGFFDYDNDGWLDIFIANGHVYPEVEQATPGIHYKQTQFPVSQRAQWQVRGREQVLGQRVSDSLRRPRELPLRTSTTTASWMSWSRTMGTCRLLLHNSGGNGNHFLNFRLVGTRSNRDAMGARIRVVAGGISQIREIEGGGSYLSQSDLRANFGLGKAARAETVEIKWPSGLQQTFRNVDADKFYLIEEGNEKMEIQKFAHQPTTAH